MSLYAVSCLKLAHVFQSLNLRLHANERFHLYWSDALENRTGNVLFNVILGNPPYSGHSSNKNQWISEKIRDYYPDSGTNGNSSKEKNLKWLQENFVRYESSSDGIVKFVRFVPQSPGDNRIPADTWEYTLCGYQVLDKLLKKNKGQRISSSEVKHFLKVVHAIQLTIQYQKKVDELFSLIADSQG
jgi:hypothetical protein